jgi:hypothetical protein
MPLGPERLTAHVDVHVAAGASPRPGRVDAPDEQKAASVPARAGPEGGPLHYAGDFGGGEFTRLVQAAATSWCVRGKDA